MKINQHCIALGSDHKRALLKSAKMNSLLSLTWELFAEESFTSFPGYLLKHQHNACLLIYSHFRHHPQHLQGETMGTVRSPACLPRNTLKSSEFKSSSRRSLRAPCEALHRSCRRQAFPTMQQRADGAASPMNS